MASEVIATDKQYPKLSKAASGYLEIDHFKNADQHAGYFCYNCIYFIKGNHCAVVEYTGPDVNGKESSIIAPHGCCAAYEANYDKLHDTRSPTVDQSVDTEKNKEKVTTADVV